MFPPVLSAVAGSAVPERALSTALRTIRDARPPFGIVRDSALSRALARYRASYGLPSGAAARHRFGYLQSGGYRLASHLYKPDSARGTIVFLHGYFDHTGYFGGLISHYLDRGYAVAALDLPGHGLSSGEPASITGFASYAEALETLLDAVDTLAPRPWFAVGHSTGASAIMEYLYRHDTVRLEKIVFLAPLVRGILYTPSRVGAWLLRPFVRHTPRWHRKFSSDTAFLNLARNDPLQADRFPLQWARACFAWNKRMRDRPALPYAVEIVQGTKDAVVAWKYNIPFLRKKFPDARIHPIDGARHHLHNERAEIRREVVGELDVILEVGGGYPALITRDSAGRLSEGIAGTK